MSQNPQPSSPPPLPRLNVADSDNSKYFVGFRCRDSHIRSRAIALLNKSLLREGIWDSLIVGCLASCVQRVEEEGMDSSGFIPEDSRAVLTGCDVDLKNESARLEFTLKGTTGQRAFRTETIKWRFGIER